MNKIPGGAENKSKEPVNIADGKIVLPAKDKVLSSMEELIPSIHAGDGKA